MESEVEAFCPDWICLAGISETVGPCGETHLLEELEYVSGSDCNENFMSMCKTAAIFLLDTVPGGNGS